ncbi:MAG TPA: glycosyltransferase, partial [Polyangiaceae bacterium]|nr:glycosyltransferase [Polyangiaceae bacterium]
SEQAQIDSALTRCPALRHVLRYDREFATWEDRLRPFRSSHVFLYPTRYAGWGLVIPEAMAAGSVVLSTPEAEASAYFVRHRVNGIFLEPGVESLEREMRFCLDNPAEVSEMGRRARLDAVDGHAPNVAQRVANALARLPNVRSRSARAEIAYRIASIVGRVVPR